jgi:hypothetical protein
MRMVKKRWKEEELQRNGRREYHVREREARRVHNRKRGRAYNIKCRGKVTERTRNCEKGGHVWYSNVVGDDCMDDIGLCVGHLPSFCSPNIALPMCWDNITDFDLFSFSASYKLVDLSVWWYEDENEDDSENENEG